MAEPTTMLKVGATDLLLRILEARLRLPDLAVANEMQAIRTIAHDVTGAATVELADGRHMTAADIQESCLAAVRAHLDGVIERNDEVDAILDLWERGVSAVRNQDPSGVDTEIEWAIKRRLIERYKERLGCALDDPRLARLEMAYHDVSPTRGVFNRLQADGLVKRVVEDQDIVNAMTQPPATTRAALRGRFVTAALESGLDYTVDWVHLKFSGSDPRTVLLKDPFRNVDERVDVLLASLDA